ncbi:MAG: type II secretion system F family protein, partial [Clostridia bacterium]|nr:type II secretion system F family protein [Clostridia bacterium]
FEINCPRMQTTFTETVRAGEQSGTLDACFKRLYSYYDKLSKAKSKAVGALIYPAIVVCVAVIVFIVIMVVAVPLFSRTFEEMDIELPVITKALISFSRFLTGYWWTIVLTAAVCVAAVLLFRRSEKGRLAISAFSIMSAPLAKIRMTNLCVQFATTMSTVISAGLPIVRALEITSDVIDNYTFSTGIKKVKEGVEQGRSIETCMSETECFPKTLTEMTGIGERSGSMEKTLDVIGDYYINENEVSTSRMLSIMEPVLTICLAVMTVILLLAVYLPMLSIYGGVV